MTVGEIPKELPVFWQSVRERARHKHRGPALRQAAGHDNHPLSFAQDRLWQSDQLGTGNRVHRVQSVMRLRGALDVAALERSLREIVRRHAILRTTFPTQDGSPVQEIGRDSGFTLHIQDLQGVPEPERITRALETVKGQLSQYLDPTQAPPWRIGLLKLGDEHHLLALILHQLVADRWSLGILFAELQACYTAFVAGNAPSLPDLPVQYSDYARWERQWLRGEAVQEYMDYWRRQLSGCTSVIGYGASPGVPTPLTNRSETREVLITADLVRALKRLSHRQGTSLFVTLLAAFKALLFASTRQHNLVLCSHIANRNRPETRPLIGNFTNLLALRTDLGGNPDFLELLERVGRVVLDAQAHQDLPFQKLVEIPTLRPTPPLTQVMFVLQNAPSRALKLPGVHAEKIRIPRQLSNFPLSLSISRHAADLRAVFRYQSEVIEADTITRLRDDFPILLHHLVNHPEQGIHSLPCFTQAPRPLQADRPPATRTGRDNRPRIAARDAFEVQLTKIWENLLQVKAVDIHDDFFERGGDSLLAVELLVQIERQFGCRLPLDMLWFHCRTLEQLASALRQMDPFASWSRLVPLKPDGNRTPLFFLPTLGGNLFHYFQLASLLHSDQPVYGLQARGVYGDERPDSTIQAIAADCIATMRTRQPRGPYLLAGYSSGGVVAFEMARQLQAQGEAPALLALLDSYLPVKRTLSRTLRNLLSDIRAGKRWMAQERLYHLVLHRLGLDRLRHLRRAGEAHRWAHWSYVAGPYPGVVDLFVTQASQTHPDAAHPGWEPLATGGLKTHHLPGSHNTLLSQPVVETLAGQLEGIVNLTISNL